MLTLPDSSWVHQSSAHIVFSKSFQLLHFPTPQQYEKVNLWQWVEIIHNAELQNNYLWKGSKNVFRPASFWKQSQLCNQTWLLRALSKYVLENLQEWKLHNLFGQAAHCLAVLMVKEFLLIFSLSISCFILGLMPPVSCHIGLFEHWGFCWATPEPSLLPDVWAQLSQPLLRGQVLLSPLTTLVALQQTHCSLSRSLLKLESNIACSFLDMAEQVLSRGS